MRGSMYAGFVPGCGSGRETRRRGVRACATRESTNGSDDDALREGGIGGSACHTNRRVRSTPVNRMDSRAESKRAADCENSGDGSKNVLAAVASALIAVAGANAAWHLPSAFAPPNHMQNVAHASAKFSKKSLQEKLQQIMVFGVFNASGMPYLANSDGENQVGLIFFSVDDAAKMQADMLKTPSTSDAKIFGLTLDKAFDMVRSDPQPSGIIGSGGEELNMVFRFAPDSESMRYTNSSLNKLKHGLKQFEGVPVFSAKGLVIRKGGEAIKPLFFSMEDLNAAWHKVRASGASVPVRPPVEIEDLLRLIELLETGAPGSEQLSSIGFVPSSKTVDYLQKMKAGPAKTARMHSNPFTPE